MPHLRFLDGARDNLVEIAGYVAAAGGNGAAVRFIGEIIDKCEHLATLTGLLGRSRPELRPGHWQINGRLASAGGKVGR